MGVFGLVGEGAGIGVWVIVAMGCVFHIERLHDMAGIVQRSDFPDTDEVFDKRFRNNGFCVSFSW